MTTNTAHTENTGWLRILGDFWRQPISAEPLAVCRIATGLAILVGSLVYIAPTLPALSETELPLAMNTATLATLFVVWILSLALLTVGFFTRITAIVACLMALAYETVIVFPLDSADGVAWQSAMPVLWLLNLTIAPAGAIWSVDHLRRRLKAYRDPMVGFELPSRNSDVGPVMIAPWSVRLMQFQVVFVCAAVLTTGNVGRQSLSMLCLFPLFVSAERLRRIAARVGRWPSGGVYRVYYDTFCPVCRRSRLALESLDLGGRLEFRDIHDREQMQRDLPDVSYTQALREMIVQTPQGRVVGGFDAFRAIARALPSLWATIPLLYLPGMGPVGRKVYHAIARRRYKLVKCDGGVCSLHVQALAGSDLNEEDVARIVQRAKASAANAADV